MWWCLIICFNLKLHFVISCSIRQLLSLFMSLSNVLDSSGYTLCLFLSLSLPLLLLLCLNMCISVVMQNVRPVQISLSLFFALPTFRSLLSSVSLSPIFHGILVHTSFSTHLCLCLRFFLNLRRYFHFCAIIPSALLPFSPLPLPSPPSSLYLRLHFSFFIHYRLVILISFLISVNLFLLIAGTTEYSDKIHNNGNSKNR